MFGYRDLGHDLTHRGKLVAGPQQAQAYGLSYLVDELAIGGNPGAGIQPKVDHRPLCSHVSNY